MGSIEAMEQTVRQNVRPNMTSTDVKVVEHGRARCTLGTGSRRHGAWVRHSCTVALLTVPMIELLTM